MPICAACATSNDDDARFCKSCGSPLAQPIPERRRLVTLVFCDLAGSTALGERLDPEAVHSMLRRYFDEAQSALGRHGGTVEKFIGDAVVAVFGLPDAHEDDALRACRAAREIQERIAALNASGGLGGEIAVRIGVNTGEVVAGAGAGPEAFASGDAVVTGDAANVAARLEQTAQPGEVLIGELTYRLVRDAVEAAPVEPLQLKGKSRPFQAYRLQAVSAARQVRRQPATRLVGREEELALLEQSFEAVAAGPFCSLVTVVGEPGVGKSRLVAEALERIGPPAGIARGACLSYGEGITYWALGQIVRELAGIGDDQSLEAARAQLDRFLEGSTDAGPVAAQIGRLLGIGEGTTTPGELVWAVRQFLGTAAAERPIVIVVDDIQWAELTLLELLAGLPRSLPDSPILIVCLARPELEQRAPQWEATLRIEDLAAGDIDALLESLGAPAAIRGRLAEVSAGNPLYAEELVAMLADEGALQEDALDLLDLPVSLSSLLNARLDRLEGRARDALERGAIEGEVFHRAAVVELSAPEARDEVTDRLDELAERDFLRPWAASIAGEAAFRFKHLLVREAAYRTTAKRLRATLHEQFAGWLQRAAGDRLNEFEEIVGYHLEQAYNFRRELGLLDDDGRELGERAAAHLAAAARRAAALSDFDAVANLLQRALALGFADPGARVRILLELGRALHQMKNVAEAESVLIETHDLAARIGRHDVAAFALVQQAWNRTGDPSFDSSEAQATSEQAIELLTEVGDDRGLALARRLRGQMLARFGNTPEVGEELERALAHAQACGDHEMLRLTIGSLTNAYLYRGPTPADQAISRCEELFVVARGDRVLEATVKRPLALFYAMTMRPGEALELLDEAGAVLDELSLRTAQVYRWVVAFAREHAGDREGAERELKTMWRYFADLRSDPVDTRALGAAALLARLYADEGRWDEAAEMLAYGRRGAPIRGEPRGDGQRMAIEARVASRLGDPEAVQHAEQALARSEARPSELMARATIWLAAAEVREAAGQIVEAGAALARAMELYEQKGNLAALAALRASPR